VAAEGFVVVGSVMGGLFIGGVRRWRRSEVAVAAGELSGAPLMAWGRAAVLLGVAERWRGRRGRHRVT